MQGIVHNVPVHVYFPNLFSGKKECDVPGDRVIMVIKVVAAAQKSMATGEVVKLSW